MLKKMTPYTIYIIHHTPYTSYTIHHTPYTIHHATNPRRQRAKQGAAVGHAA